MQFRNPTKEQINICNSREARYREKKDATGRLFCQGDVFFLRYTDFNTYQSRWYSFQLIDLNEGSGKHRVRSMDTGHLLNIGNEIFIGSIIIGNLPLNQFEFCNGL
jgi:hypothetical protein